MDKESKRRKGPAKAKPKSDKSQPLPKERSGYALKDDVVERALITGEHRDLLETYFGEEVYQELKMLSTRAQSAGARGGPRVLILPGIMGSKLGKPRGIFDDAIWLDPKDIMAGKLRRLSLVGGSKGIEALGVMLFAYLKLKLRLKLAGFDAGFHPFDWRRSISKTGKILADRIRQETESSKGQNHLYLVAHSMGGLVSRAAFQILKDEGAEDKIHRLIMLGTPNFGSFSPVQALSGGLSLVQKLAALDISDSQETLINEVFNTFPGLYQMLPASQRFSGVDLYKLPNWPSDGPKPRERLLAEAPNVHQAMASGDDRFTLIAGINKETVVGVRRDGGEFIYTTSVEGDGTVPLAFAQMEGVQTYYVEEAHGSLANNADVSQAVIDLIETATTTVLSDTWSPANRGVLHEVRNSDLAPLPYGNRQGAEISSSEVRHMLREFAAPPGRTRDEAPATPAQGYAKTTGEPIVVGRKRQRRIDLHLVHGSITQVDTRAIVLGLFRGVTPSGASRAIDDQLGGVIADFTERRMITANVGEVFMMPANRYRIGADMVLFAGLGAHDDYDEEVLRTVSENAARALVRTKIGEFATVLMSSGSGMSVGAVLANLLQGFLRGIKEGELNGNLHSITLCEDDKQRFDRMHAELLRLTTTSLFDDLEVIVDMRELPQQTSFPAPPGRASSPSRDPVYLIVREMTDSRNEPINAAIDADFTLRASLLTAGRRATVITDTIDIKGADLNAHLELRRNRSLDIDGLKEFGNQLAEMVLPPLLRAVFSDTNTIKDHHLVVIHDGRTSRIPWEMLCIKEWYPAASAGLSRKYEAEDLSVAGWLEERRFAKRLRVLLIVNPTINLDGADKEGERIKILLERDPAIQIEVLSHQEATWSAVRARFKSGDYDVIHYAGHAFFDASDRSRSGILCYGNQVLSGRDLVHLEKLPALVFFNACESGKVRGGEAEINNNEEDPPVRKLEQNAGLAEAFLRAGVGNYLGTYWPVGDEAAEKFAETFYGALVKGSSVGYALLQGRKRVVGLASVDWSNYMHYGSPDFVVKRSANKP